MTQQDRQASQNQASGAHEEQKELLETKKRDHCNHTHQHQQAGSARICQSVQNGDTSAESSITPDVYVAEKKKKKHAFRNPFYSVHGF